MTRNAWALEHLGSYLAGGLSTDERLEIQELVKTDPELAAALDELRGMDDRVRQLFAAQKPPFALEDRVIQSLRRQAPSRNRGGRSSWPMTGMFVAASVMLLLLVGFVFTRSESQFVTFRSDHVGFAPSSVASGPEVALVQPGDMAEELTRHLGVQMGGIGSMTNGVPYFGMAGGMGGGALGGGASVDVSGGTVFEPKSERDGMVDPAKASELKRTRTYRDESPSSTTAAGVPLSPPPAIPASPLPTNAPAPGWAGRSGSTNESFKDVIAPTPDAELRERESATKSAFKPGDVFTIRDEDKASRNDVNGPAPTESAEKMDRSEGAAGKNADQDLARLQDDEQSRKSDTSPDTKKAEPKIDPKQQQPTTRRIIIRSGDIEFEVDSFDQAVETITRLIGKTKGGFIATTNSDKLANGKMRGSVVVRMPPEELDDFVLSLRRELGKNGELKGQRIGSQDVTKRYTDLEGELRGLRVSEERLLGMLRDTKAQLKDLLAVENQLATTRTKIEKIEGEVRYYANMAALSTLTISLHEKEIRQAAGVVESERVQAGIEADDVDKAFQEARVIIDEFKGRVFRSELKQGEAGQFNAILQFDVAPEHAGPMRDRLRQLGVVARLEIDRVQKVEGGGTPSRDSKIRRGDAQFLVSIYNLANVTPRESVQLSVIGSDVPTSYRKLRELIGKLRGNLWNTSLQNIDARNVIGVLDFDVRRTDESTMQTALSEAGEFLSRKVERAAESNNVTDSKIRFRVRLISVGGIQARETNNLSLAALDVPASYRKIRDAVVKANGFIRNANLQENDPNSITASLQFDVLRADEAGLHAALQEAGEILTRRVDRRPEGETVTDAKIGFIVSMVSVASLRARETVSLDIAAVDVPEAFTKLKGAIAKLQAHVRAANLQETDRETMNATLEFDVLRTKEPETTAALLAAGETLTRNVERQPSAANITDAKVLFRIKIVSTSAIEPRETHTLGIEVRNVHDDLKVFHALVKATGGRVITGPEAAQKPNGQIIARVVYDVPLSASAPLIEDIRKAGLVTVQRETKNPRAPDGKLAVARIDVTLSNADLLVPRDQGFLSHVRNGVSVSLRGLSVSASWLIVAVLFVGPWVILILTVYWLVRKVFGRSTDVPPSSPTPEVSQS